MESSSEDHQPQIKLILLRHAHRELKSHGIDVDLNEIGHEYAKNVVKYALPDNIDIIYSSPYNRCLATVFPYVYPNRRSIRYDVNISEYSESINRPSYEDIFNTIHEKYEDYLTNKNKDIDTIFGSHMESEEQFNERVNIFINRIRADAKKYVNKPEKITVLVCTHGAVIQMIHKILTSQEIACPEFGEIIVLRL